MHLVFDIFQGIGVAAAVGIRPFLPALVTGALAAGDVEISFRHSHVHFAQGPVFLFALVLAILLVALAERRFAGTDADRRPLTGVLAICSLGLGAILAGGAIARHHHSLWIGVGVGIVCAAIGLAATGPLLTRVRARLDAQAGAILPALTDGAAALAAALSVLLPPFGVVVLAALVWLLVAGRGRSEQKYAGLRILR